MNMIRHDNPAMHHVALPVEKTQRPGDNFSIVCIAQQATSIPGVKPMIDPRRKSPVILGFALLGPWGRKEVEPYSPFLPPLFQFHFRQRISQSECQKIAATFQLPVRKAISAHGHLRPLSEKANRIPSGARSRDSNRSQLTLSSPVHFIGSTSNTSSVQGSKAMGHSNSRWIA